MSGEVEARLATLGLTLPTAAAPVANYVPSNFAGNLLFISGQLSRAVDGTTVLAGKLGAGVSLADGQTAARSCAIALLAQAKAALGDLDRIQQCVKLLGFVNSTPEFTQQPAVLNGCSDLLVEVLGNAGRHARSAIGTNVLPMNAICVVEAIFLVEGL